MRYQLEFDGELWHVVDVVLGRSRFAGSAEQARESAAMLERIQMLLIGAVKRI